MRVVRGKNKRMVVLQNKISKQSVAALPKVNFEGRIFVVNTEAEARKAISYLNTHSIVDVYTSKKEFIACGHFQIGSIAVRVLSFVQETIDHEFWVRKLAVAKDLRVALGLIGNPQNNTYRLVHGEGDNLPGLIIDVYDHTAVMQAHSAERLRAMSSSRLRIFEIRTPSAGVISYRVIVGPTLALIELISMPKLRST
jgi:23S rRNA G2069 N7-methylase RlmK/C1962 C5-methylase RlmI